MPARFLLIILACCLLPAPASTRAEEAPAKSDHASLAAYPTAVISLREAKSEMLFYVESDGRRLVAFDKEGKVAWSTDVMAQTKVKPERGVAVIRHLLFQDGNLFVVCGKSHTYKVDVKTGSAQFQGND